MISAVATPSSTGAPLSTSAISRSIKTSASAALHVLTDPSLLSLVASFQRGVPSSARPFITRYVADGHVSCIINHRLPATGSPTRPTWWYEDVAPRQQQRIVTPLCKNVTPKSQWLLRVLPEVIATYETHSEYNGTSLSVLRAWLRSTATAGRVQQHIVHRTSEAAAAYGRLDLLQWLHDQRQFQRQFNATQQVCLVRLATRHGHVDVLSWLEATYGRGVVEHALRGYTVLDLVKRNHVATLQWLLARNLGVMPRRALHVAIDRGDLFMLRFLLESWLPIKPFPVYTDDALIMMATLKSNLSLLKYLILKLGKVVLMRHVRKALQVSFLDGATFLLERRSSLDVFELPAHFYQDMIAHARLDALATLASAQCCEKLGGSVLLCTSSRPHSVDAVTLLLPLSSTEDIATTLVWAALSNRATAACILNHHPTLQALPCDLVAFVDKILNATMVPVVKHTPTFADLMANGGSRVKSKMMQSSNGDLRVAMVYFLWKNPNGDELPAMLELVRTRPYGGLLDKEILELCVVLAPTDQSKVLFQKELRRGKEAHVCGEQLVI